MASDCTTASMADRYAGFDPLEFDRTADRVLRVTMGMVKGFHGFVRPTPIRLK
jgi:hypothetical protein